MYPFAIDFTVKGLLGLFITNVRGHEQSCYLGQVGICIEVSSRRNYVCGVLTNLACNCVRNTHT